MSKTSGFAFILALLFVSGSALAAPPKLDEAAWTAVFGTAADGPSPTFIKGLHEDMSPAEAGAVFKGAEKPSKFGFAKLTVKGVPGVKKMEIYFAKDKETKKVPTFLKSVTLTLDAAVLKDAAAYEALIKVLTAKYGPIKKAEDVPNYKVTWALKSMRVAQVWKIGRDLTFKFSL